MLIFGQHCVKHNLIERLCFISKSKSDLASELPVAARLQLGGERQGRQSLQCALGDVRFCFLVNGNFLTQTRHLVGATVPLPGLRKCRGPLCTENTFLIMRKDRDDDDKITYPVWTVLKFLKD